MATGQNIKASEFNAIRTKVEQILGGGGTIKGDRGYNQVLLSWPAIVSDQDLSSQNPPNPNLVTKAQWDALKKDILNIRLHQLGTIIDIANPSTTEPIRYGSSYPNTQYDNLINQAITDRLNIGTGRSTIRSATTKQRTTAWSSSVSTVVTVDFPGFTRSDGVAISPADHARSFFNSGSKIRILSNRTGGAPTAQNNAWTSLLVQAASKGIGAYDPKDKLAGFYNLTDEYKLVYQLSSSSPYANNNYKIEAKCDVADNLTGTATKVFFKVTFTDGYIDRWPSQGTPDKVDGTLIVDVEEVKAPGPIFRLSDTSTPTGSWALPSPTYSITDIVGS